MAALIQIVVPSARKSSAVVPGTRTLHFVWNANPEPEVTGYKLYVGRTHAIYTVAGTPVEQGNVTSGAYDVPVGSGTWYFALTAHTAVPLESEKATEVSITV